MKNMMLWMYIIIVIYGYCMDADACDVYTREELNQRITRQLGTYIALPSFKGMDGEVKVCIHE